MSDKPDLRERIERLAETEHSRLMAQSADLRRQLEEYQKPSASGYVHPQFFKQTLERLDDLQRQLQERDARITGQFKDYDSLAAKLDVAEHEIAALTEALKGRDALLADIHRLALHAGFAAQIDWLAARKESE